MSFTFGSLFAGIGGLDLGLERAGMQCQWQVEIDSFAQKVLTKHWPDVPKFGDVRTVGKHNLPAVDLICGGFPCQDISQAKTTNAKGLDGERSGLWSEFYRIICELRPRYAVIENVSALLQRGISRVLGSLSQIGYDAEWQTLRANTFGLPHRRERLFIIAYSHKRRSNTIFTLNPQTSNRDYPRQQLPSSELVSLWDYITQLEKRWGTSSVCRKDDGLPYWLDRLGAIGNAVVPQVAEYIGKCILASEVQA